MKEYLDRAVDKLRAAKAPADRHGAAGAAHGSTAAARRATTAAARPRSRSAAPERRRKTISGG